MRREHERPYIKKAVLIDDRRIELYWNTHMRGADTEKNFCVRWNGEEQKLVHYTGYMDWGYGTVYQKENMRTTISLENPIDVKKVECLTLQLSENVTDIMDMPVDTEKVYTPVYEPYYSQTVTGKSGIPVKGSSKVQPETLQRASELVDIMLQKIPQVSETMRKNGVFLAVFGVGEDAYDIPEHRMGYITATRPVEGFGGGVASVSEANVIRRKYGRYATVYPNESILVHEFGHSVHISGIDEMEDKTLSDQLKESYEHASASGLFPNTYAISNIAEYFATLCTIWFNVMQEGSEGRWDGVRGPVNTRAELKEYDPQGYQMMQTIFDEVTLPAPWDENRDAYYPDGSLR